MTLERTRSGRSHRFRGVALDVDGTLVASVDAHARAWVFALAEAGREVELQRVRPLIGKGGDKLLPEVTGIAADSAEGRRISERRGEIFRERELPHLRATAGARDLVERLREEGFALAVASSARPEELEALLAVAGTPELVAGATDSGDVTASKPDPDIVHVVLGRLGTAPGETLLVGDTRWDIEAAAAAGVAAIALRSGGMPDADLAGALAIYDDPADLVRRFDASPLGREDRGGAPGRRSGAGRGAASLRECRSSR